MFNSFCCGSSLIEMPDAKHINQEPHIHIYIRHSYTENLLLIIIFTHCKFNYSPQIFFFATTLFITLMLVLSDLWR